MNKLLIVVDVQNDFVSGALGSNEARAIVPNVKAKIEKYVENKDLVIFTKDTHNSHYDETQEGQKLPIPHCMYMSEGWELCDGIKDLERFGSSVEKMTFGFLDWEYLIDRRDISEIEIIGLCTDICVVSNAIIIKNFFSEIPVTVDASCCAGTTPEKHTAALNTMESCQINILR
jgi:nicotinamidase-related amidase